MTFKCGQTRSKETTGHPFFKEKNHNSLLDKQMCVLRKNQSGKQEKDNMPFVAINRNAVPLQGRHFYLSKDAFNDVSS